MEKSKNHLNKVNLPYILCDHLLGENHKLYHRLILGTMIILAGAGLILINSTSAALVITHTAGVIIDGIGVIPWLELVIQQKEKINNNKF